MSWLILLGGLLVCNTIVELKNYKREKLRDRSFYSQHCESEGHKKKYHSCNYPCEKDYYGTRLFWEKRINRLDEKFKQIQEENKNEKSIIPN